MPISVELSFQQAFADLEALSGPWQDAWETSDPDHAALLLRLFGTHLQVHSDRIMKAMVLEQLDQEIQRQIAQLPAEQSVDQD
tara:strand:+ start:209 stop:457 length:249 start_codon:yes stop_codon:yes gene_type:complete